MISEHTANKRTLLIFLSILFLFVGILIFLFVKFGLPIDTPDGDLNDGWQAGSSATATFRYPETLGTKYISPQVWPPSVEVTISQFICAEALRRIGSREYCVGEETEGAAGSVYTTYTYNTMKDDRMVSVRFTLKYSQCDNYDDLQKTECKNERETFDLDNLVDRIVQTVEGKN